jgi:hypothetical protein
VRDTFTGGAGHDTGARYGGSAERRDARYYGGYGGDREPAKRAHDPFIPMPGTGAPSILAGFEDDDRTSVTAREQRPPPPGRDTSGIGSGAGSRGVLSPPGAGSGRSPLGEAYSGGYELSGRPDLTGKPGAQSEPTKEGMASRIYGGPGTSGSTGGRATGPGASSTGGTTASSSYNNTYKSGTPGGGMGGGISSGTTTTSTSSAPQLGGDSSTGTQGGSHVTRYYGELPPEQQPRGLQGAAERGAERVEAKGEMLRLRGEGALDRAKDAGESAAERVRRDAAAARDSVRSAEEAASARMRGDAQRLKDAFAAAERDASDRVRRDADTVRGRVAAAEGRISSSAEGMRDTASSAARHVKEDLSAAAGHVKRDAQAAGGTMRDTLTADGRPESGRYSSPEGEGYPTQASARGSSATGSGAPFGMSGGLSTGSRRAS